MPSTHRGAQLDVFRTEIDGVASHLGHPGLKGNPRPQRGFFEDHRQRLVRKRATALFSGLDRQRQVEQVGDLPRTQIRDRHQVFFHASLPMVPVKRET
jgi:hypothetical protein